MRFVRIPLISALVWLASCGGGDGGNGGVTPPPPPPTVATVEVAPTTATLLAPATQQLTAVAKDATGATLTRTFTWTSSSAAVATVSASGLVTSVAAGTATITAAVDGKQGTATITVVANSDGPIVARGAVGAAGGTIGTDDIAVTVPAGALATTATLELVRDTVRPNAYGTNAASATYLVDGLPSDRTVPLRVRLKRTAAMSGAAAIGVIRPTVVTSDRDSVALGSTLVSATDSAGYLVATVPLRGRPAAWATSSLPTVRQRSAGANAVVNAVSDPTDLKAAAELTGLIALTKVTSAAGHFEVWGFGETAALAASATRVAQLLEQGRTTILGMGYSWDHRVVWPMQAYLAKGVGWNGVYRSVLPDPFDPNLSSVGFNLDKEGLGWFPGTVIHELFHFTQAGFTKSMAWPTLATTRWLGEITSTWISEKHPAVALPINHPTPLSWVDSLWTGLNPDMVAESGYGKAPLAKWLADTYGEGTIKQIYTDVGNGATPIAAFLMAFPANRDQWFQEYLQAQLGHRIYTLWPVGRLSPLRYRLTLQAGRRAWETDPLFILGVEGTLLVRDTAGFGPNFSLPIFLDTASSPGGMISVFRKTPNVGAWIPVGSGDTVKVPGSVLRSTDSLMLTTANLAGTPPYSARPTLGFRTDLSLPPGDVQISSITGVNNGLTFSCTHPGDVVDFDPAENVEEIFMLLNAAGTWQKTAEQSTSPFATYTWRVDPAYADSLARSGMTLQSTMTVGRADTVRLQGRFAWNTRTSLRSGGAGTVGTSGSDGWPLPWWSVVIALLVTPVLVRRGGAKRVLPVLGAALLVFAVACGSGFIALTIDETFDYTFTKLRFTADAANPNAPLMELRQGAGKTTMTTYRMEHWVHFTTEGKPDSAISVCTRSGTGNPTYTVNATMYKDGVEPPDVRLRSDRVSAIGKALGIDLRHATPAVRMQLNRR